MFLPNCARISFPFPAPYRSAKPVSATCGLQSRSIWTAHRSPTAGSMQIVPISTQNGDPICKPSGTSRSSRRESGKSTMFLFPKMPCPPASVPCGSRLRFFQLAAGQNAHPVCFARPFLRRSALPHLLLPRFRRPPLAVQLLIRILGEGFVYWKCSAKVSQWSRRWARLRLRAAAQAARVS